MRLRPYQSEALAEIQMALRQHRSTLAVLATGLGKTVLFSRVIDQWPAQQRCLVLAHREELIFQAAGAVERITGERPEIEMGEWRSSADDSGLWGSRCVVSSVQTLSRPNRIAKFRPEAFGLVVIDEAHHAVAETYQGVLGHFRQNADLRVLGVTATPDRADELALGQVFDSVAYEYGIAEAVRDGWLVPIDQQFVTVADLDFSSVKTLAGDLSANDLERVMTREQALHGVVHPTIELAGDRPTIVFAASVAHAELMAEIFRRHRGDSALCLHGKTPAEERRAALQRFAAGEFQYLVNCGLFLEGFDSPRIACVAVARPTKSRSLYAQMIGRGTRPIPGTVDGEWQDHEGRQEAIACSSKPALLVLDFVGNSGKHKLVSTAEVLGGNYPDEVVDRARARAAAKSAKGEPADIQQELFDAAKEMEEEARRKRRAVVGKARFATQKISPFDVFDIVPKREPGWHKGRGPTEKQLETLHKAGVDTQGMSFAQAQDVLHELFRRRDEGLCTFKQARVLQKYGYDPAGVTFAEATRLLAELAANGWRRVDRSATKAA